MLRTMKGISGLLRVPPVLLALTCSAGCQSAHKVVAARYTECPYKQLEISGETYAADQETWIAHCGERRYLCSTTNVDNRLKYRCRTLPGADAGSPAGAPDASVRP
jgi:hypothetical protein